MGEIQSKERMALSICLFGLDKPTFIDYLFLQVTHSWQQLSLRERERERELEQFKALINQAKGLWL